MGVSHRRPGCQEPTREVAMVRQVLDEHGRALVAYAARRTGNRRKGDDIVVRVLADVWLKRDQVDPRAYQADKRMMRWWLFGLVDDQLAAGPQPAVAGLPPSHSWVTSAAAEVCEIFAPKYAVLPHNEIEASPATDRETTRK